MRFPKTESEIMTLVQNIISGLANNPNFPSPPVSPAALQARLDAVVNSSNNQIMAQAAAKQATDTKQADFDFLIMDIKTVNLTC